jgi:hypothetical protein
MRHLILQEANSLQVLRGCVKLLPLLQPTRARPHGRTDKSNPPESHPTKENARACVRRLNTETNYY